MNGVGGVNALIVLCSFVISLGGGWAAVRLILRAAKISATSADTVPAPGIGSVPLLTEEEKEEVTVLRGGTWIGFLERFAITGALIAGQASLIAVVVAIKGLGRWPELFNNPGTTERFIIGTLASMTWAATWAIVALMLIN